MPGRTKTPTSGDFTGAPMRAGRRPDAVIRSKKSPHRRWPDWVPGSCGISQFVIAPIRAGSRRSQGAKDRSCACARIANPQADAQHIEREMAQLRTELE